MKPTARPGLYLAFVLLLAGTWCAPVHAAENRPNIVFLLADDWGWGDLSCHGNTFVSTPNLDRLAKEGTDFHQFYSASPVCSPSRAAFMNGVFPARLSVRGPIGRAEENRARNQVDWVDPRAVCLPRLLKMAGYVTGHFGKWHLSGRFRDAPTPAAYGFDEHALFETSPAKAKKTDHVKMFDEAVAFITRHRDKPFFLNVWVHETHLPHYPIEADVKANAKHGEQQAVYSAIVAAGDRGMGRVLDALRKLKLERNTIVIFSSDNGPQHTTRAKDKGKGYGSYYSVGSTGGLRGRKRSLHEGGVRVPFIVRWPGHIPAGRIDNRTVVAAVDFLPTLCAAAGVALPKGFKGDGENLLPALLGKEVARTKALFWDWHGKEKGELPDGWPRWAVRDGDWKLLTNNAGRRALYNIKNDKAESRNLAADNPAITAKLSAALDAWKATLPKKPPAQCLSGAAKSATAKSGDSRRSTQDTADEPLIGTFSLPAAAGYLDRRAHLKENNCYACHSTFTYLPARSLIDPLADEVMRTRIMLERLLTKLNDPKQAGQVKMYHTKQVRTLAALELARHDAITTGTLAPITRQSLDRMWRLQAADGGFPWLHVGEAPQAIDDWWPAAMVAVGVAAAPDGYAATEPARSGLNKLRGWFQKHPAETVHEKALTLLAHAAIGGIVTNEHRDRYIETIFSKQQKDGGWSMADLAPWKRKDGKRLDPSRTDGYATALAIYVIARNGLPPTDPRLKRGIQWLKRQQRESGGWFTQSPFRQDVIASNTGTSFAIQALAACGQLVPPKVTREQFLAAYGKAEKEVPQGVIAPRPRKSE